MIIRCVRAHGHESYRLLMRRRTSPTQHSTSRAEVRGAGRGVPHWCQDKLGVAVYGGSARRHHLWCELVVFNLLLNVMSTMVTPATPPHATESVGELDRRRSAAWVSQVSRQRRARSTACCRDRAAP